MLFVILNFQLRHVVDFYIFVRRMDYIPTLNSGGFFHTVSLAPVAYKIGLVDSHS